jgi:RNA polymerase-binding transcription factor DksA
MKDEWTMEVAADPLDQGTAHAEAEREVARSEQSHLFTRDNRPKGADETERTCIGTLEDECENDVGTARLKFGALRCIDCQTAVESYRKARGQR